MQRTIERHNNVLKEKDRGSLSDKSGFSAFCGIGGCGFVKPTANGRCPSCNAKITRESTFDSATKLFEAILNVNRSVFNSHIFSEKENQSLMFLVNIGKNRFWVPFRYFVELENIERTDRSQLENFFEYVKSHCNEYKP